MVDVSVGEVYDNSILGGKLMNFLLAIGLIIFRGFTMMCMWSWFIVQFGLPTLSLPHAIGVCLVMSCFNSINRKISDEETTDLLILNYSGLAVVMAVGYIVRMFL